jgi:hypothetical protein
LILISTTTLSPAGQAIRHPISSILCIYFPLLMPVYLSAGLYSFSNQLRSSFLVWISTRWLAISLVLIVWSSRVSFSHIWNHRYDGAGLFSCTRSHIAQLYIICFVAPLPPFIAWSTAYCIKAWCCSERRILLLPAPPFPTLLGFLPLFFARLQACWRDCLFLMKCRRAAVVGFSSGFSRSYCKAFCVFILFGRSRGLTLLGRDLNRAIFETEVAKNDSILWW